MLAKMYLLNRNGEILRVLKEGKWVRGEMTGIKFRVSSFEFQDGNSESRIQNPEDITRNSQLATRNSWFAVVVSKKVFVRAVDRNRAKRLISEAVRWLLPEIKSGYEVVLLVQSGIEGRKMQEVKEEVERLFRKAGLFV